MVKTNAMRLLSQAGIEFGVCEYEYDENDLNGMYAAEKTYAPEGLARPSGACFCLYDRIFFIILFSKRTERTFEKRNYFFVIRIVAVLSAPFSSMLRIWIM